jgi:hypothetical protein
MIKKTFLFLGVGGKKIEGAFSQLAPPPLPFTMHACKKSNYNFDTVIKVHRYGLSKKELRGW